MSILIRRLIQAQILMLSLCIFCGVTMAQGTASGPTTFHDVTPGPFVSVGPQGIDLDANGPPWTKYIFDDDGNLNRSSTLSIRERIINIGNEPWHDWHEHIIPGPTGAFGRWTEVQLLINGAPILFNTGGIGTADLTLDGFSQSVLPGDTLTINKSLRITDYVQTPGAPVVLIQEYPTPEPASLGLIGLGSLVLLKRRKEAPLIS